MVHQELRALGLFQVMVPFQVREMVLFQVPEMALVRARVMALVLVQAMDHVPVQETALFQALGMVPVHR